jgi:hypothetical protein
VTAFWWLLGALGVAWIATMRGSEEFWMGLGLFGLVGGILLAVKWIGADRGEGGKP